MKALILLLLFTLYSHASFIRDINTDTILDTNKLLMWQDDSNAKTLQKTWIDAINYCDNLSLAGFNDWRLSNINELISILEIENPNIAIHSTFTNISDSGYKYWSSTTFVNDTTNAWSIYFRTGKIQVNLKTETNYFRCIRDFN